MEMIDFQPNDEQQLVRETMASFAREVIRPRAREADESGVVPEEVVRQGWELGLVQSLIPEAYGGYGDTRSVLTGVLLAEELAWGDLAVAIHLLAPRLVALPLLECGSEAHRERYLPAFCGPAFHPASAALVEPRFDFDPGQLATRAERQDGHYVLSGSKCFVPLGSTADPLLVYAREGEEGAAFLVDRGTPGLTVGEREKNMGIKALETVEIELAGCRVPAEQRLAGPGGRAISPLLDASRVALAAMAVGVARGAFEYARDYAKERRAFGSAIGQKQAIAFALADMAIEVDAVRLLTWQAAWRLERGGEGAGGAAAEAGEPGRSCYLAKRYAADMAVQVADRAVQILGGYGYIRDHPVEMWLRNCRGFAAFEGLAIV